MKAILLEKPEHFTQIDIDEPHGPGAGDVLVQVHRVGICGTDCRPAAQAMWRV